MPAPSRQLSLDLPLEPRYGPEDFIVGPSNALAHGWLERWPDWPDRTLVLVGPEGSGKTHLASMLAARTKGIWLPTAALAAGRVPSSLAGSVLIIDGLAAGDVPQTALFHLLNRVAEEGGWLLLTGRKPPAGWSILLPDLTSRLRRAPLVELGAPDDALLRMVIVKQFFDRQLVVNVEVVEFLARRLERSFVAVQRAVAAIDREMLAQRRNVSRALAAQILALSEDEPLDEE